MTKIIEQIDINELLINVSLNNQKAFSELYKLTSPKLFAISLRIIKDSKLAEDVLQESFIQIWDKAAKFDPDKAQAITWMGTIVRNKSIDLIRKLAKDSLSSELDEELVETGSDNDNPEQLNIKQSMLEDIHHCMSAVSKEQKQVILMAYLEGYSHQQISDQLKTPVGTIKSWIKRGVGDLKHCLSSKYSV